MLNRLLGCTALFVVALVASSATAGELKSGPQVGEEVHGFNPLNCTGDHAGEKHCLICENGANPVAIVFARQVTPEVTKLIKRIDQATDKNAGKSMGSFAVLLNDAEALESKLKELAKKEKIEHCVLTIDDAEGPKDYNIATEAEVTVVLYCMSTVKANYVFKKGELNDKGIAAVVADLAKILPK
jgi:hypothetical protein